MYAEIYLSDGIYEGIGWTKRSLLSIKICGGNQFMRNYI